MPYNHNTGTIDEAEIPQTLYHKCGHPRLQYFAHPEVAKSWKRKVEGTDCLQCRRRERSRVSLETPV